MRGILLVVPYKNVVRVVYRTPSLHSHHHASLIWRNFNQSSSSRTRHQASHVSTRSGLIGVTAAAIATTTTLSSFWTNKQQYSFRGFVCHCDSRASLRRKAKMPPRYGPTIPHHIRRNATTTTAEGTRPNASSSSSSSKTLESITSSSNKMNQKKDCPLCKKYSSGPCGKSFQQWMDCIDANPNQEHACDNLLQQFSSCLEQHKEHYDAIDVSELSRMEQDQKEHENRKAWEAFLHELEEGGTVVEYRPFPKGAEPEMQIRLRSKAGAVSFPSLLCEKKGMWNSTGTTKQLIMAYIKDQNDALLGSGSVDDLFYYQEGNSKKEEEGMYALRFEILETSHDITAFALYEEESDDGTERNQEMILFRHTERLPKSRKQ